jgi:hypothetical protein
MAGVRERADANRTREAGHLDEIQGVAANRLKLFHRKAVGFIGWLDVVFKHLYLNNIPILQLIRIAKINICSDLKDHFRRISVLASVGVRPKDECFPTEDLAGHDADRNSTTVLIFLHSQCVGRRRVATTGQIDVQCARK